MGASPASRAPGGACGSQGSGIFKPRLFVASPGSNGTCQSWALVPGMWTGGLHGSPALAQLLSCNNYPPVLPPCALQGSLHQGKADRLKGPLSLLGLLASQSPQVASAQADAGFLLSLGDGVGAERGLMAKDQRLRGVKPSPQATHQP